jgi:hypothetical protein
MDPIVSTEKKLNAKKNVNVNFIFASAANVKPLTANRGLRSGVNKINVNLKVSNDSKQTYAKESLGTMTGEAKILGLIWNKLKYTLAVDFTTQRRNTQREES